MMKCRIAEARESPRLLVMQKLDGRGKRSLSNVIPLVDIRVNQVGFLK